MISRLFHVFIFTTAVLVSHSLADTRVSDGRRDRPISADERQQGFRKRTLLAKPRAGLTAPDLLPGENAQGTTLRHTLTHVGGVRVLELSADQTIDGALRGLRASGRYDYVEPDYIKTPHAVPNDPRFTEQWALRNTGQDGGTAGADIGAVAAWDTRSSAAEIVVAVIDTGVRVTHEDLADNIWRNPGEVPGNGIDDDHNGYIDDVYGINSLIAQGTAGSGNPDDDQGHGTSVASVIGAVGNNGKGMSGVAWRVKIMALKFDDVNGSSSISNEIECIDYAIAKGAKIINLSYGSLSYSQAEYDAIKRARDAGVIFVASAGNEGASNDLVSNYPASYFLENVVSVANTDRKDELSSSSVYGGLVDLGAPGTSILTCSNRSDSEYRTVDGTSFSSPTVAGALALVRAQFPTDSYRAAINRILRSVDPLASLAGKVQTGGRLNVARALTQQSNRPFNDDFANRASLTGDSTTTRATSIGASAEGGEPVHGAAGGASLWWSWTAPRNGSVVLDTSGSNFDTTLAVYTGSAVGSLSAVASNDDATGATSSRVAFTAVQGTTYQIAVDGKGGASGLAALAVGLLPANDNFAEATTISGVSVKTTGTTKLATREAGEPTVSVRQTSGRGKSVWYRWTAPRTGSFAACAFTESFGAILGVYTGTNVGGLNLVAREEDAVTFDAISGVNYYILVDSSDTGSGTFTFTLLEASDVITFGSEVTPSQTVGNDGSIVMMDSRGIIYYFKSAANSWVDRVNGTLDVSTPAISSQGTIYVGTSTGLYALNPNQTEKWSKTFADGVQSSPAVAADGSVYVHAGDGYLYAFFADGTQKWKTRIPGVSYSSPSLGSDGTIYVGSDDHNVYAIFPTDGSIKWKYDTGDEVFASVAIGNDGTLYVGNLGSQFHAISPSGVKVWSYQAGNDISSSAAIAPDGTIYFGCYDGKLYALNSNGTLKWTYTTGGEIRASSPLVASDGTIYIGSYDQSLHAVSSNGTVKQTYPTAGIIRSSPLIYAGQLFFGSSDKRIYGIPVTSTVPSNSPWAMHRQNLARTGRKPSATAPLIKTQPASRVVGIGNSTTLAVNVEGQDTLAFQWYFNGIPIVGATQSTYTISNASPSSAGNYTVVITNGLGSVTSAVATVSVAAASDLGHIVNLSARAVAGSGSKTLIVGFVIAGGSGNKPLLVRAVGPTLANFSVPGFLVDPQLTLFSGGGSPLATNDNWVTDSAIPALLTQVGAFAFASSTSKDAAMSANLPVGGYTAHVTSSGASGVALAEFYDASPVYTADTPRLTNISARSQVGTGGDVLIVGFVIAGSTPRKVLIRGIGPGLIQFGVDGILADPKMTLKTLPGEFVQENDNWGSATNLAELQSAMSAVNAFPLGSNSKDAVIVATLQPGGYTAVISGVDNTIGVALAEVYELP